MLREARDTNTKRTGAQEAAPMNVSEVMPRKRPLLMQYKCLLGTGPKRRQSC
jgi:hypothetical protein